MRELRFEASINDDANECAGDGDEYRPISGSNQRIQGAWASSREGPTASEYDSTCNVAHFIEGFWCEIYIITMHRLQFEQPYKHDRDDAYNDGTPEDSVHVDRLEVKHFLNAKPGNRFALDKYYPEKQTNYEKFNVLHYDDSQSDRMMGTRKYETGMPPIKKPVTAVSDPTLRSERPMIPCPEVHPLA